MCSKECKLQKLEKEGRTLTVCQHVCFQHIQTYICLSLISVFTKRDQIIVVQSKYVAMLGCAVLCLWSFVFLLVQGVTCSSISSSLSAQEWTTKRQGAKLLIRATWNILEKNQKQRCLPVSTEWNILEKNQKQRCLPVFTEWNILEKNQKQRCLAVFTKWNILEKNQKQPETTVPTSVH